MVPDRIDITLPRKKRPPGMGPPRFTWEIADIANKLRLRSKLPGAFVFDQIANDLDEARRRGLPIEHRLAAALPSSWMVNNKAPSPVFFAWLQPEGRALWSELVGLLEGGPEAWAQKGAEDRSTVVELSAGLTQLKPQQGICALSKVLALLVPETVPLLDDAAIHVLTEAVEMPPDAEKPTATSEHLLDALDAFCGAVAEHHEALETVRSELLGDDFGPTSFRHPAQVLDRLLWFDSWGHQHFSFRRVVGGSSMRIEPAG